MKYLAQIEYLGVNYSGWQSQTHSNAIQNHVDNALSKVSNSTVTSICAGRTDTGVNATSQIIHFESDAKRSIDNWYLGVNSSLPNDICIKQIKIIYDDFHARFSAKHRRYQYLISIENIKSSILFGKVLSFKNNLDVNMMNEACQYLIGEQDFTTFRASNCQSKTAMRNIIKASVYLNNGFIVIDITANAFLYHMVRNIVGSLLQIGMHKMSVDFFYNMLKSKNRQLAPATAPSYGLYFVEVAYENQVFYQKIPFLIDKN